LFIYVELICYHCNIYHDCIRRGQRSVFSCGTIVLLRLVNVHIPCNTKGATASASRRRCL